MMAGTEMLRIADMSKIEIRVDVGENDIPKLHLGDSAIVTVDAYTDRKFKGIVTQIASSNNGASTQNALANTSTDVTNYKVYVRLLPESYSDLLGKGVFPFRPGMSASTDIQTKTHFNVLSVPINAVTTRDINDSTDSKTSSKEKALADKAPATADDLEILVFVVDKESTVKKVKVKTDIQDINNIEITEGLKEGDEVVTGPYDVVSKLLKQKDKVKVVDKKDLFEKKKE
jgi:HlyD family secretion protein